MQISRFTPQSPQNKKGNAAQSNAAEKGKQHQLKKQPFILHNLEKTVVVLRKRLNHGVKCRFGILQQMQLFTQPEDPCQKSFDDLRFNGKSYFHQGRNRVEEKPGIGCIADRLNLQIALPKEKGCYRKQNHRQLAGDKPCSCHVGCTPG